MKEIAGLTALQNKRCKNATETSLILLDIDRRKKLIEEVGGAPPSDDTLVSVLWVAMDPKSRDHISGKLDPQAVGYAETRNALMQHIGLAAATHSSNSRSRSTTAMDVSAIA